MITITQLSGFGRGKAKSYPGPNILLGTDAGCDLRFDPAWDKEVSPRHAQISIQNGECWIEDLGSSTGVWIGGKKIVRQELQGTVEISLGQHGQRLQVAVPVMVKPAAAPQPSHPQFAPHAASPHSPSAAALRPKSKAGPVILGVVVAVLAMGTFFGYQQLSKKPLVSGASAPAVAVATPAPAAMLDSDEKLRLVAKRYEKAVGVVVFAVPGQGKGNPSGTAWAVEPNTFATNSHITELVEPLIAAGGAVFVVINKHPDLRFRVTKAITHPKYLSTAKIKAGERLPLNMDGKPQSVAAYDVGLLIVDADPPVKMSIASQEKLMDLDSGHRLAYLGFPMENLNDGNIDVHYPVATMQSGIVTSVSDAWMAKTTPDKSILIHHNLPSAGGASGSPIFDTDGDVVGLHSAGNYTMGINFDVGNELKYEVRQQAEGLKQKALELLQNPKLTKEEKDQILAAYQRELSLISGIPAQALTRVTSASLINFAQRVDLLKELLSANGNP